MIPFSFMIKLQYASLSPEASPLLYSALLTPFHTKVFCPKLFEIFVSDIPIFSIFFPFHDFTQFGIFTFIYYYIYRYLHYLPTKVILSQIA